MLFTSTIVPSNDISLFSLPSDVQTHDLPMRVPIIISTVNMDEIRVVEMTKGVPLLFKQYGLGEIVIPSVGIGVRGLQQGEEYVLDVRNPPRRQVSDIVSAALSLTFTDCFELFASLREAFPEYERGFKKVTDTLYRFCMLLFAQSISLERLKSKHV